MRNNSSRPREADGIALLYDEFIGGKPDRVLGFCEAAVDSEVAGAVYEMRERAGLTQAQLAKMVGTTKSAISRIEDSNYHGHSMAMLRRIGNALGYQVSVSFKPVQTTQTAKKVRSKAIGKGDTHRPAAARKVSTAKAESARNRAPSPGPVRSAKGTASK